MYKELRLHFRYFQLLNFYCASIEKFGDLKVPPKHSAIAISFQLLDPSIVHTLTVWKPPRN